MSLQILIATACVDLVILAGGALFQLNAMRQRGARQVRI